MITALQTKSKNRQEFSYITYLYINSTPYDLSDKVEGIKISDSSFNSDFMPITSEITIDFQDSLTMQDLLLTTETEITIEFYIDSVLYFKGYLDNKSYKNVLERRKLTGSLTFLDYTQKLKTTLPNQILTNKKICDYTDQSNSLFHILVNAAGLSTSILNEMPAILDVFGTYAMQDMSLYDVLYQVLLQKNYSFSFKTGKIKVFDINFTSYIPDDTVTGLFNSIEQQKIINDKSVLATYTPLSFLTNQICFIFQDKDNEDTFEAQASESWKTLDAGEYFPADNSYMNITLSINDQYDIYGIVNEIFTIETYNDEGSVIVDDYSIEGNNLKIRLKNNSVENVIITKFNVSGSVAIATAENIYQEGISSDIFEISFNQFVSTDIAKNLVNNLKFYFDIQKHKLIIHSNFLPYLENGDIVHVTDSAKNIDYDYLINSIAHDINNDISTSKIELTPLEVWSPSTSGITILQNTINQSEIPVNIIQNIQNTQDTTLQLAEDQTVSILENGIDSGTLTTTPTPPIVLSHTSAYRTITIRIEKQYNLIISSWYQAQVSEDEGTTWKSFDGITDQFSDIYSDVFNFFGSFSDELSQKTYYFRIRRKTKNDVVSSYAEFNHTIDAIGTGSDDLIYLDSNNYWSKNAGLRVGETDSFFFYDIINHNIIFKSVDLELNSSGVMTYYDTNKRLEHLAGSIAWKKDSDFNGSFDSTIQIIDEGKILNNDGITVKSIDETEYTPLDSKSIKIKGSEVIDENLNIHNYDTNDSSFISPTKKIIRYAEITATGWYRIFTAKNRFSGRLTLIDETSGCHQHIVIDIGANFPNTAGTRVFFQEIHNYTAGTPGTLPFLACRWVYNSSDIYADYYFEIQIDYLHPTYNYDHLYFILEKYQDSFYDGDTSFAINNWEAGSVPAGYQYSRYFFNTIKPNFKFRKFSLTCVAGNNLILNNDEWQEEAYYLLGRTGGVKVTMDGSYDLYMASTQDDGVSYINKGDAGAYQIFLFQYGSTSSYAGMYPAASGSLYLRTKVAQNFEMLLWYR